MRFPTPAQLDQWAQTLTATRWHDITHQLNIAITREVRGGNNQPDGYPTSTRGGGTGGAELTSVEAAAAARIAGTRDEHHELTRNAIRCVDDILYATGMVLTLLAKMEAASIPADSTRNDWCSNHLQHGHTVQRYRGDLCEWCYRFQLAERFLPTAELLAKHDRGRVYDRDIAHARAQRHR